MVFIIYVGDINFIEVAIQFREVTVEGPYLHLQKIQAGPVLYLYLPGHALSPEEWDCE